MVIYCALLLLWLCSCGKRDNWQVSYIQTGNRSYDSSKLTYFSADPVNGVDLEILKVEDQLRAYLHVHTQTIPSYLGNPKEAFVTLYIEGQPFFGVAARHEGGQRVLLSPELQATLLEALQERKNVTIALEGFSTLILAENFKNHLKAFGSVPMRNPFHFPVSL
jgi:hypothetical protein